MKRTRPNLPFRVAASLLALIILVPSLCSARCSSHFCAPTASQPEGACHQGSSSDDSTGVKAASGKEPCAVAELVSIAPRFGDVSISASSRLACSVSTLFSNSLTSIYLEPVSFDPGGGPPSGRVSSSHSSPLRI